MVARQVRVLTMVLAGGEGKRLAPLTADRAKPAVPFGGHYRLVDFVLSNVINSGYLKIVVLTQYKSHSLDRHIAQAYRLSTMLGNYVATVPAQMREGPRWFAGSADAIFQNLNLVGDERPDVICVFGADHIYRMDPRQMVEHHLASGAALSVAGIRVPLAEASSFGVMETADGVRIDRFREKPADARGLPDAPDQVLASMGNYAFTTAALVDAVTADAGRQDSRHDLGSDVIPALVARGEAAVYDFSSNIVPGVGERERGYWRDVGEPDAYHEANMDLVAPEPMFSLYNRDWPIHSWHAPLPPAKFVFDEDARRGMAIDSLVSNGVIVSGATVRRSVLSPEVFVHSGALVEEAVLMDGVDVGRGAVVRKAVLDKGVRVAPGARIGVDLERDRERFTVSPGGVVVIGKNGRVDA